MVRIEISTGKSIEVAPGDDDALYQAIVTDLMLPYYQESNDWPETIKKGLSEIKAIAKQYSALGLDKNKARSALLEVVQGKLGNEIAELPGVDKIEILFLDLDDYMQDIESIIRGNESPKEIRFHITNLIQGLTEFELGEIIVELAKIAWK